MTKIYENHTHFINDNKYKWVKYIKNIQSVAPERPDKKQKLLPVRGRQGGGRPSRSKSKEKVTEAAGRVYNENAKYKAVTIAAGLFLGQPGPKSKTEQKEEHTMKQESTPSKQVYKAEQKPASRRRRGFSVLTLIEIAATVLLIVSVFFLGRQLWEYKVGKDTYTQLQQEVAAAAPVQPKEETLPEPESDTPDSETKKPGFTLLHIDFDALRAQNPNVVGWLAFDALDISYPVLDSNDNTTYLYRLWDGRDNKAGSLFVEEYNNGLDDLYTIIYGHNMRNGTMFGSLKNYESEAFWRENGGMLTLYTPDGAAWRYQIFAVKEVDAEDALYAVNRQPGEEYRRFLTDLCRSSRYDTGVTPGTEDKVLVFSTCVADDSRRLVVLAKQLGQVAAN